MLDVIGAFGHDRQNPERLTITGGVVASPFRSVTVEGDVIYESLRWSDDQNTLPLPAATTFDAKVTWRFLPQAGLYFAVDNITNAAEATSEGGDHVYTYDEPRAYRAGLTVTF